MATSTIDLNALLSSLGSGASGINVSAAVAGAIYAEQAPERQWQLEQANLQAEQGAINQINSLSSTLSDAVQALADPVGALFDTTATSSATNILTATAQAGAVSGSHVITVNSLATTGSWYSDEVSSSSTPLNPGSFSLQVGSGNPTTITIGSGVNTLDDLASYINGQNLGVNASVVNDANGARLAIVSQNSGSANDISISGATGLLFHQAAKGQDASLTVDGIPVDSASNTVTGAVSGLTLNLQSAAPGTTVNVSVGPDSTSIANAVNNFVSAYNALIQNVSSQFVYDPTNQSQGPLADDSSVRSLQDSMLGLGGYVGSGTVSTLSDLGITMNNDGTLSVDSTALNNAIQNNMPGVQNFFQGASSNGFANTVQTQLNTYTDPTQGAFTLDLQSIKQQNSDLQDQIDNFDVYIASEQTRLQAEYSQADIALQQLPNVMNQINAMLGNNTKSNG